MLRDAVLLRSAPSSSPWPHMRCRPTYFPVSKVTSCFQTIVDAYGIARYREANPAVGIPPSLWVKFSLQLMQLPVRFSKDPSAFSLHMWVARITAHSLH